MPWNGSGQFNRTDGVFTGAAVWEDNRDASVKIRADRHDTHDEDIATGLENAVTRDGQNSPTANLPMAGFRHTNVGDAVSDDNYATFGQVQNGEATYVSVVGGTADAITLSPAIAISSYVAGQQFVFSPTTSNTGAVTVNVSGLGLQAIVKESGQALAPNDLSSNQLAMITYNGTRFHLHIIAGPLAKLDNENTWTAAQTFSKNLLLDKDSGVASFRTRSPLNGNGSFPVEWYMSAESSLGNDRDYFNYTLKIKDNTDASEDGEAEVNVMEGGALVRNAVWGNGLQLTDGNTKPTGQDKGTGSINAVNGLYDDGVRLRSGNASIIDEAIPTATDTDEVTGIDVEPYQRLTAGAIDLSTSTNADDTILQFGDATDYTTNVTYIGQTIDESGVDIADWATEGGIVMSAGTTAAATNNLNVVFMERLPDSIAESLFGAGFIGWAIQVGQQRPGSAQDRGFGSGYFGTSKTIDRARIQAGSNFDNASGRWFLAGSD